jgi:hypothetical protein
VNRLTDPTTPAPGRALTRWPYAIGLILCWPAVSLGQLKLAGTATVRYESNNNIFDLPVNEPAPNGNTSKGDSILSYMGGVTSNYTWKGQSIFLEGNASKSQYDSYSRLNNTAYALSGGLNWSRGRRLNGNLRFSRQRHQIPFYQDLPTTQLLMETTWNGAGMVTYEFLPQWNFEVDGETRGDDAPRAGAPDLSLRETSERVAIRFGGISRFSLGLSTEYSDGRFKGELPGEPTSYSQVTSQLEATYTTAGLSQFQGNIGYTKRKISPTDTTSSGVTGALRYTRHLTGKTTLNISLARVVNTYIATSGAELDENAAAELTWQATGKLDFSVNFALTHGQFTGGPVDPAVPATNTAGRVDRLRTLRFDMHYKPEKWLAIHPYTSFQHRTSDLREFTFSATTFGVEATAQIQ